MLAGKKPVYVPAKMALSDNPALRKTVKIACLAPSVALR